MWQTIKNNICRNYLIRNPKIYVNEKIMQININTYTRVIMELLLHSCHMFFFWRKTAHNSFGSIYMCMELPLWSVTKSVTYVFYPFCYLQKSLRNYKEHLGRSSNNVSKGANVFIILVQPDWHRRQYCHSQSVIITNAFEAALPHAYNWRWLHLHQISCPLHFFPLLNLFNSLYQVIQNVLGKTINYPSADYL